MRVDTNFFGTVPMPDAGDPTVAPTSRRYGNDDVIACYENMLHWSQTADGLGFDTMWLTEHHFQHEGYEVLPNLIMFGVHGAARTKELRFGQMFNVVPQWHPLRLAEDFALADVLTGGRMEFGVGRGTVPREAWALGTVVASGDNEMSAEHDRINREVFEEAMEVIKLAWSQERFAYRGKHFVFPPDDVPDRGTFVNDLTLIPKPRRPIDVYQPVTSPETIEYVPRAGHKAVYWLQNADSQKEKWDRYAAIRSEVGQPVGPGEDRCLVLNVHVAPHAGAGARPRPAGPRRVLQVPLPLRPVLQLPVPGRLEGALRLPAHARGLDRLKIQVVGSIDDVVDALGLLARPARPAPRLLLLRLSRPAPRGHRRADAPHGRGGVPPPGRTRRAAAPP